ncbi:CGLD16 [Auxenochlorella protothecoides x Auxenochlorella symbiontica]
MMSIHSPRLGGLGVRTGGCCLPCPPPSPCRPLGIQSSSVHRTCRRPATRPAALGGPDDEGKAITRDNEPDEYWKSAAESKGQNPAKDPLALIFGLVIVAPFLILGIAIATGVLDISVYKGR